jgi:putative transposase
MNKIRFSEEQIKKLAVNKNVKTISKLSITYQDDFKLRFIEEYLDGESPREIFRVNGFSVEDLGIKRIEQCTARWKKDYEKDGILELRDNRKTNSGRKSNKELSSAEIISIQEAKIKLLEEQVNILKS